MNKLYLFLFLLALIFVGCASDAYRGLQKSPCACIDEMHSKDKHV